MRWLGVVIVSIACLAVWAGPAAASQSITGSDDQHPTLAVDAKGVALVTFHNAKGHVRHLLAWGAVNGVADPDVGEPQEKFKLDYSGGWKSQHDAKYWQKMKNTCRPYDGPELPFFVVGCKARDGSYWALQTWQRFLPMRGFDPWLPRQSWWEVQVSHWSGGLPVLEIYKHWTYANAQQGFFGRLVYDGKPVYGTRSPSASVSDPWARNIYIDAFDSDYGKGWRHDTAINTHPGNGGFCYSFVPQAPPKGYPARLPNGNGLGERYRISVMGPGVTPVVQWEGPRLGAFERTTQAAAAAKFDEILGGDKHCAPER